MQIEYDGVKEYKSHSGIDTKFIFPKAAAKIVATDERMLFVDGLVPRTEYTFNISAYFTDDTWGPVHQIRVQTSIGGLLYRSLYVFQIWWLQLAHNKSYESFRSKLHISPLSARREDLGRVQYERWNFFPGVDFFAYLTNVLNHFLRLLRRTSRDRNVYWPPLK